MKTEEDIYIAFRAAQSEFIGRPYRIPKNFNNHFNNRFSKKNKESLILSTKFFNTKWSNIRPMDYFRCGFSLYGKNFSYVKFFEKNIMRLYIQRDKIKKRENLINKKSMIDSMKFVMAYMKESEIPTISRYCLLKNNGCSMPVKHYLDNKIDKFFLVFLIKCGYLTIEDREIPYIPYVIGKFREIIFKLEGINEFLKKLKERIEKWEIVLMTS